MAFLSPANTVKLWRFLLLYIVHVTSVTMHRSVRLFSTSTHQYLQKLEAVIGILYYRIFRTISRNFFKNSGVAAYIAVRLMCGRFQETTHYTLHATACLYQHLITINSPTVLQSITDSLSSQPCGHTFPACCFSLSLSFSDCVSVDAAVYCTHRQSVGKRPPDIPCWARSSAPQMHAGLWPIHVTQLTHFVGHTVLAWHQITASPQTFAHTIKPACSVFWTTSIASCCSFADLLITCVHPRTFLRARK